jgi:hypothetical protein
MAGSVRYNGIGTHVAASGRVVAADLTHPFSHLDRASNLIVPLLVVLALAVWFDTYVSMARFALTAFPS